MLVTQRGQRIKDKRKMISGITLSNDTATVCIEEGNCKLVLNCFLY